MQPPQPPFPEIPEDFFGKHGNVLAHETWLKWKEWLRCHPRVEKWRKYHVCLALCGNVCESTVKNWTKGKRVAPEHAQIFRDATEALGWHQPSKAALTGFLGTLKFKKKRGAMRLVVFTALPVVSESYHLQVLEGIMREAKSQGMLVSLHEVPGDCSAKRERVDAVRTVITRCAADAALLLRITPDPILLKNLVFDGCPIPTVLIHADRLSYPPPIITNVVPGHQTLAGEIAGWLWSRPHIRKRRRAKVVMLAMRNEPEAAAFPKKDAYASIRNERIASTWAGLDGFQRVRVTVRDYGFQHAWRFWDEHRELRDADAFVCLSDALAVGLKHVLLAARKQRDWHDRVIGFDGGPLAREEGIVTVSQNLYEVGQRGVRRLCEFLIANRATVTPAWPKSDELETVLPVTLKI